MEIAYLIAAHSDPNHLRNLINSLNYNSVFFIHIDKKSNINDFKKNITLSNVYWIEDREDVSWAGISQVYATLKLIQFSLNTGSYIRYVFISGSCFPLKSKLYINNFFQLDTQTEYIQYIDMTLSKEHYLKQIIYKWYKEPIFKSDYRVFVLLDKFFRYLLNKFRISNNWNYSLTPYYGSSWWALTHKCCQYIIKFVSENPEFLEMNKYTFASDEHFFHTIVGNSVFNEFAIGLQPYTGRGTYKLANLHLIHKSLSKWYSLNDLQEVLSSDKLFVRKLNTDISSSLVNKLNEINI